MYKLQIKGYSLILAPESSGHPPSGPRCALGVRNHLAVEFDLAIAISIKQEPYAATQSGTSGAHAGFEPLQAIIISASLVPNHYQPTMVPFIQLFAFEFSH